MDKMEIGFNRVSEVGNEIRYIKNAIARKHISGAGRYTEKCNQIFEEKFLIKKSILATSCTHALEAASILLNIKL